MTDTPEPARRRSTRVVALLVAVVVVIAVAAGTVALVAKRSGGGGSSAAQPTPNDSPTLHLSRTSTGGVAAEAAAAGGSTTALGGYDLRGTLSTSTSKGVVIDASSSTATRAQVTALLQALGMGGVTPTQVDGGWTARGTAHGQPAAFALDETGGNVWQFARGAGANCLAVSPGSAPGTSSSCTAVNARGATATAPSRAALVKAAGGVFSIVGVTPGTGLTVHDADGVAYLDVPLTVEGLPVVGVDLSVGADADGLTSAIGWLHPSFSTVGSYPLVSARTAYGQLAVAPVPALGIACPAGKPCPTPAPQVVTAARLAWLTSRDSNRTVLVPAWQFEVDGFYDPAVVAVSPSYLGQPTTNPTPAGSAGVATGAPGSAPASTAEPPAPPLPATTPN